MHEPHVDPAPEPYAKAPEPPVEEPYVAEPEPYVADEPFTLYTEVKSDYHSSEESEEVYPDPEPEPPVIPAPKPAYSEPRAKPTWLTDWVFSLQTTPTPALPKPDV